MKILQIAMDDRHKVLVSAGANQNILTADGSRNSTNNGTIGPLPNLGASVKSPWERATTPANVPYYIEYVAFCVCVCSAAHALCAYVSKYNVRFIDWLFILHFHSKR